MSSYDHSIEPSIHPDDSVSGRTSTARRRPRPRPAPAKGVSLGLEEEVEFGSDEDTMDAVGEIAVPVNNTWYPGRPDSPPKSKKGISLPSIGTSTSHGSKVSLGSTNPGSGKSRPGILGRREKAAGLGDARVVSMDEMRGLASPTSSQDLSLSSRPTRESSDSVSASSLRAAMKKDKSKSKVFGKLFGRKGGDDTAPRMAASGSVESFGSASRRSEVSVTRSILKNSGQAPSTHTPRSQSSSEATGLPSIPTTPFSVDARSPQNGPQAGHRSMPSCSSTSALIQQMQEPGVKEPDTHLGSVVDLSDSHVPTQPTEDKVRMAAHARAATDQGQSNGRPRDSSIAPPLTAIANGGSAISDCRPLSHQDQRAQAVSVGPRSSDKPLPTSNSLASLLFPSFPTSEAALDTVTILSTTVMRRMPTGQSPRSKSGLRHGTGGSMTTAFGAPKRPMWQTHQLILTSFRMSESTPYSSPNPASDSRQGADQPAATQTFAHLHLFAYQSAPKPASRPGSSSTSGKKRIGSLEGATKVEVDRQAIGAETTAGVWESSDEADSDTRGRKWVLRVRFSEDQEEWLCDMPTGDTLFEWVRQINAYSTVIKAETLGFGEAIRSAHLLGATDLTLELELHEQGLRSTPKPPQVASVPAALAETPAETALSPADAYRTAMIAQGHAADSPSAQPPISMHDFFTRKSLSPRGQDLATFLDTADVQWRTKQAQLVRAEQAASGPGQTTHLATEGSREDAVARDGVRSSVHRDAHNGQVHGLGISHEDMSRSTHGHIRDGDDRRVSIQDSEISERRPSVASLAVALPPVPPPRMPLPATPKIPDEAPPAPSIVVEQSESPDVHAITTDAGQDTSDDTTTRQDVVSPYPDTPAATRSHRAAADGSADLSGLSIHDRPAASEGIDGLSSPRYLDRNQTNDSLSAQYRDDDSTSMTSKSSSARARRFARRPLPAMDLMSELSGRPEMNYEKPIALRSEDSLIDENRPRRIRFG